MPEDQDKAMAYELYLRQESRETCSGCGSKPADWLDERGRVKHQPPFEPVVSTCWGCKTLAEFRDSDDMKNAEPGTTVSLRPFEDET